MCLRNVDFKQTAQLRRRKGTVTAYKVYVYKVYVLDTDQERRICLRSVYKHKHQVIRLPGDVLADLGWDQSINVSKEERFRERRYGRIEYGIHVYANRQTAQKFSDHRSMQYLENTVVVPVTCRWNDLRGIGTDNGTRRKSMVFTKITIEQKTWDSLKKAACQKG